MLVSIVLLLITGIAVLVCGVYLPDKDIGLIVSSVGGAIAGASLSGIFNVLSNRNSRKTLSSIVEEALTARFLSDQDKLLHLQRRWHQYGRTEIDGQQVWRHTVLDFTDSIAPGVLATRALFPNKKSESLPFHVDGFVRDHRLVLLYKSETRKKLSLVAVMPFMAQSFRAIHCGFWLLITWDGTHGIYPIIISESPVNKFTKLGAVDSDTADILDAEWKSGFSNVRFEWPSFTSEEGITNRSTGAAVDAETESQTR